MFLCFCPAGYLSNQSKKLGIVPSPQVSYTGVTNGYQIADSVRGLAETGNSNETFLPASSQSLDFGNGKFSNGNMHASDDTNTSISGNRGNGFSAEPIVVPPSDNLSRSVVSKPARESQRNNSASSSDSSDDEICVLLREICVLLPLV